jgi:hypothetical protein
MAVGADEDVRCSIIVGLVKPRKTASMLNITIESLKNIKIQVEGGFKPLDCRVQVYDYGRKLRFKVFDKDYDIAFEISDLALKDLGRQPSSRDHRKGQNPNSGATPQAQHRRPNVA